MIIFHKQAEVCLSHVNGLFLPARSVNVNASQESLTSSHGGSRVCSPSQDAAAAQCNNTVICSPCHLLLSIIMLP